MKKTIIAMLALAGLAAGEQNLTIDGSTTGNYDALSGANGNTVTHITVTENATVNRIDGSSLNNLTTITLDVNDEVTFNVTGYAKLPYNCTSQNYSTTITLGANSRLAVGGVLYFGTRNSTYTGITQNTTIVFGEGASVSAGSIETIAPAGGSSTLTLSASFDATVLSSLTDSSSFGPGSVFDRLLISTTNGLRNYDMSNISVSGISDLDDAGYSNVGVVSSLDDLNEGDYGLLFNDNKLSLVAKAVPEPATATLSLLALAGLLARRRR